MKYFSLDLETTRLKPKAPDGILMASIVFEDSKRTRDTPAKDLPSLTCLIDQGDMLNGPVGYFAMAMNAWLLLAIEYAKKKKAGKITPAAFQKNCIGANVPEATYTRAIAAGEKYPVYTLAEFSVKALEFFTAHVGAKPNITVVGKNVASVDMGFLPEDILQRIRHRTGDPGSMFVNWDEDDEFPGSEKVKERAGIADTDVSHDAHEDACGIIDILRTTYGRRMYG